MEVFLKLESKRKWTEILNIFTRNSISHVYSSGACPYFRIVLFLPEFVPKIYNLMTHDFMDITSILYVQ